MHHDDNYELLSSVDGPLSAQIKYIPGALFNTTLLKGENKIKCCYCSKKKGRLFICEYKYTGVYCLLVLSKICHWCRALQRAYMQSGGSDPAIMAQMINLQKEAQSLERNQPATAAKARKKESKNQSDDEEKVCSLSLYVGSVV